MMQNYTYNYCQQCCFCRIGICHARVCSCRRLSPSRHLLAKPSHDTIYDIYMNFLYVKQQKQWCIHYIKWICWWEYSICEGENDISKVICFYIVMCIRLHKIVSYRKYISIYVKDVVLILLTSKVEYSLIAIFLLNRHAQNTIMFEL